MIFRLGNSAFAIRYVPSRQVLGVVGPRTGLVASDKQCERESPSNTAPDKAVCKTKVRYLTDADLVEVREFLLPGCLRYQRRDAPSHMQGTEEESSIGIKMHQEASVGIRERSSSSLYSGNLTTDVTHAAPYDGD